jgi:MoaA/NifB/PqqE/SkfB family radical SAM enzyme
VTFGRHIGDTIDIDQIARRLLVLRSLPVFFNGLVLITTTRCNAKCGMCYQAAGPKGSPLMKGARLDLPVLKDTIREAATLEAVAPRCHIAGGEAFIRVEDCLELIACARESGFSLVSATTNAFWAKRPDRARKVAQSCAEAGLSLFEISWDHWHKPWITPGCIENCIIAASEAGIETNLRLLTTRKHFMRDALEEISHEARDLVSVITSGPVTGAGRGAELGADELFIGATPVDGNCHSILHLTVDPTGEVAPCCAGLDQTGHSLFGNVKESSLAEIVEGMQRSALLRILVFDGVASFLPVLEDAGVSPGRDFVGICDMCWSIFADPERTRAIEEHLDRLHVAALESLIEDLNKDAPELSLADE